MVRLQGAADRALHGRVRFGARRRPQAASKKCRRRVRLPDVDGLWQRFGACLLLRVGKCMAVFALERGCWRRCSVPLLWCCPQVS